MFRYPNRFISIPRSLEQENDNMQNTPTSQMSEQIRAVDEKDTDKDTWPSTMKTIADRIMSITEENADKIDENDYLQLMNISSRINNFSSLVKDLKNIIDPEHYYIIEFNITYQIVKRRNWATNIIKNSWITKQKQYYRLTDEEFSNVCKLIAFKKSNKTTQDLPPLPKETQPIYTSIFTQCMYKHEDYCFDNNNMILITEKIPTKLFSVMNNAVLLINPVSTSQSSSEVIIDDVSRQERTSGTNSGNRNSILSTMRNINSENSDGERASFLSRSINSSDLRFAENEIRNWINNSILSPSNNEV